jgi:hypothetical protein
MELGHSWRLRYRNEEKKALDFTKSGSSLLSINK